MKVRGANAIEQLIKLLPAMLTSYMDVSTCLAVLLLIQLLANDLGKAADAPIAWQLQPIAINPLQLTHVNA